MRHLVIAGLSAAVLGMGLAAGPAQALPVSAAPGVAVPASSGGGAITQVQWRRGGGWHGGGFHGGPWRGGGWRGGYHRGWGGAALGAGAVGLATGAIIGGALAAPRYDPYYGSGYYAPAPVYVEPEATGTIYSETGGDEAYCIRRFKSYDPASGTYLGYDGLRHPCP